MNMVRPSLAAILHARGPSSGRPRREQYLGEGVGTPEGGSMIRRHLGPMAGDGPRPTRTDRSGSLGRALRSRAGFPLRALPDREELYEAQ